MKKHKKANMNRRKNEGKPHTYQMKKVTFTTLRRFPSPTFVVADVCQPFLSLSLYDYHLFNLLLIIFTKPSTIVNNESFLIFTETGNIFKKNYQMKIMFSFSFRCLNYRWLKRPSSHLKTVKNILFES